MAHHLTTMVAIAALSLVALVSSKGDAQGIKWAVLVAGSNGYMNYRHQADICHAQGVIINRPQGGNLYPGVPKDYTGESVTASNLLAVILGNKRGVKGGSGKVVTSGPNDYIFIYYADHGSPGVLSMPSGDDLYAKEFTDALKTKHASGTYRSMVIYVEACEAGSIFDGLLPDNLNIYVTTASNPTESSYATYCPDSDPAVAKIYQTCLGDLYSVSWMEDCDKRDQLTETLEQQYEVVKKRTAAATEGSHVMQYGDTNLDKRNPSTFTWAVQLPRAKWRRAPEGSKEKDEARKRLDEEISQRMHVDQSMKAIAELLFGAKNGEERLNTVRPAGQPLVDDWDCLKSLVETYKRQCGTLSSYGMKYMRALANFCNAGVRKDQMAQASTQACST
ncbi:hypothetical protein Nepgr_000934 [Nepenthes gracilis]|uniref:Legumain prodomain domain-containing protein n=1 Tax=Nepenthes gracilis TaxID=150966 RepID=A0AAD3P582_NEPGR|nr:hypothetical protein Nepgr_000934 [Nepenthes gracilis]